MTRENLAKMIDHTLLKPEATKDDIKKLCEEAVKYGFYSVCINSCWVSYAAAILKNSGVKICSVVGFPLGAVLSETKAKDASLVIEQGGSEIDMVINIGYIKSKMYDECRRDIEKVKAACKANILKVIIETCLLTKEEKITACQISLEAKADFVKTSTGFSAAGANAEDVRLMRETVGNSIGVKAAGGVRTYEDFLKLYEAGANRFGTSGGVAIVNGLTSNTDY